MSASLNHVAFSEGIYFEELLEEQALKRIEFVYKSRLGFIADASRYFRCEHSITELLLAERRMEVCIRLLKLSKKSLGK